jgi:dGTPase
MAQQAEAKLAPYAMRSSDAGGRAHAEPEHAFRDPFELDRHRIIESTAFRRLEGKTQVFAPAHHDHFRTRLTHTLEAAQIARCLAKALKVNEDLAEAITLAHDLGHPPFGHVGETALNEAMTSLGGFNHNTHSLRVVEYIEHPFPAFRGLNLTPETRAGLATHETRYDKPAGGGDNDDSPHGGPSVEAQIASIADRIAYNCHDLEDAIGAGFCTLKDLAEVELWREAYALTVEPCMDRTIHAVRRGVLDAMLDGLLADVIATSQPLLASIGSPEEARTAEEPLVTPSADAERRLDHLEAFLMTRVYQHPLIIEADVQSRWKVLALVIAYRKYPYDMPVRYAARIEEQGLDRVICDYIAGMTDRFCTAEYERLFMEEAD